MAVLPVCTALPNQREPQALQDPLDFPRFEDGNVAHCSGDLDGLNPDELGLQTGLAILEQERDNLAEIALELVKAGALGVGPRPAWDIPNEDTGFRITLDDSGVGMHGREDTARADRRTTEIRRLESVAPARLTNPASVAGRLAHPFTNQRLPSKPARPGHCTRWLDRPTAARRAAGNFGDGS